MKISEYLECSNCFAKDVVTVVLTADDPYVDADICRNCLQEAIKLIEKEGNI